MIGSALPMISSTEPMRQTALKQDLSTNVSNPLTQVRAGTIRNRNDAALDIDDLVGLVKVEHTMKSRKSSPRAPLRKMLHRQALFETISSAL